MRTRNWLHSPCCERRAVLALALTPLLFSATQADDSTMPPQPDDRFVFLTGPKKGQVVKVEDLLLGGPQVQAYPMSQDGTVRNESRLNLVILARFDPADLTEETQARAAEAETLKIAPQGRAKLNCNFSVGRLLSRPDRSFPKILGFDVPGFMSVELSCAPDVGPFFSSILTPPR